MVLRRASGSSRAQRQRAGVARRVAYVNCLIRWIIRVAAPGTPGSIQQTYNIEKSNMNVPAPRCWRPCLRRLRGDSNLRASANALMNGAFLGSNVSAICAFCRIACKGIDRYGWLRAKRDAQTVLLWVFQEFSAGSSPSSQAMENHLSSAKLDRVSNTRNPSLPIKWSIRSRFRHSWNPCRGFPRSGLSCILMRMDSIIHPSDAPGPLDRLQVQTSQLVRSKSLAH